MISIDKIGANVKKYRKLCSLSQAQLAELADISTVHMSHIETGSVMMSLDLLLKICDILHVTPNHLLLDETDLHLDNNLMQEKIAGLTADERKFVFSVMDLLVLFKLNRR